jgi:hypothetical protein
MINHIQTILTNDATVSALATNGIWMEQTPQGKAPPYLVLGSVDGDPTDSKTSTSKMDVLIISVFAYGTVLYTKAGNTGAVTMLEAVRNALDGYDDTISGQKMYIRLLKTTDTDDISIPGKPLVSADQEYQIYATI